MDLQAMLLEAAGHRVVPTRAPTSSASQGQPGPRPQQLGVGDDRRRGLLPPRPPPPSRGEARGGGGVGKKADEVRGARDTRHGSGGSVATREAAPVAADADAAAVAAVDGGPGPGVARDDKGKGGGDADAGRKRGLGLAAFPPPPPPKRRLVSATRRFPPGHGGRDAAADDDSRLVVVARTDGASVAPQKTASSPPPALSDAKAGSSSVGMQVESSASAQFVSAPIADSGHHGLEAAPQRSSETSRQSSVPSAVSLLDTNSQGHAGSAGFVRKELVPATRRVLPKPRKVSAVRTFTPGCGRDRASLVAGGGNTEVALPLPEKAVATDCSSFAAEQQGMQIAAVPCNATITDHPAEKVEFVEGEIAAPKVQHEGSLSCTNVTLHESAACRDGTSVPAIGLPSQEKRPSSVVAKDVKVVTKSAGSSANALAQSLSEGPSKEHMVSAKMGRVFSGVASGPAGQGATRRDKIMSAAQKEIRSAKLIQKTALSSEPRPFAKIKEKETEHGKYVTTNGSEHTAGFAKHQVVQAPTSGKNCLRIDREDAATIRDSFGPKKKENVKQKSMLPSNVAHDILKALAAHEEKHGAQNVDARSKVKMMSGRFEFIRTAIIRAVEQHSLKLRRIDLAAADLIKKMPGFTQHGPFVGKVPGIEVGDEFLYRVELNIVGLHRPYQGGIDTSRDKYNVLIAISVVASGGYPDQLSRSGELVYTGSGGKISGRKGDGDQKLQGGNLALKNCIRTKTPVRLIHRFQGLNREAPMFTYDGLYNVVSCWREGEPGSKVFKYKLQRIPGQAELHW